MTNRTPKSISNNDRLLNDFATRCFRDVADCDYISARLAYRANLFSQFLWASHQAVEKYFKCILLQNRIAAPNVRHDLSKALAKLEAQLAYPITLSEQTRKFVEYLNQVGPWRYLEVSYYLRDYEIVKLDCAVWEIRRFAEPYDYWITSAQGQPIDMLPFGLDKIRRSDIQRPIQFPGIDGLLEKILANRKHPAREALIWQNLYFGSRERKHVRLRRHMNAVNAPLYLHPEILDEVERFVLIPKEVASAYRQLAAQQRRERSLAAAR